MTTELTWLSYSVIFTAILWVPYILNMISVRGLADALGYPANPKPMSDWAVRLKAAHYNAVENLVVFGLLVLVAHAASISTGLTVTACIVYFWARLTHAVVYAMGIPVARTLAFAVSWLCILSMAMAVLL